MSNDFDHLNAIYARLDRERERLEQAKTPSEVVFRELQVASAKKEIRDEFNFLELTGVLTKPDQSIDNLGEDALLAELMQ